MRAMPKCLALKHAAAIGPLGTIRPCCAWDNNTGKETQMGEDFSANHAVWDKQLQAGWLPECAECEQDEKQNGKSLRLYYNEILADSEGVEYWDFKINNTCNLTCRMCDPVNSSSWVTIQRQIDPDYKPKTQRWHREIKNILPELYTAKVIKFTGGEPFMIPQVMDIVKFLVNEEIAPAVRLEFITNGTHDISEYYHLLSKFSCVTITISVDAVGDRFEYIRQGADWNQVSTNIININKTKPFNTNLGITCLPQALNINHIHEVKDWCKVNQIRFNRASDCIHPDYMTPGALDTAELRQKLISRMTVLDKIHGTNYRDFI